MAKHCYIYETLNGVKDLNISRDKEGLMTLSGVFGVCGVRNNNSRVYESSNYSKMVTEMQNRIKQDKGIPGELEHPKTMNITLENVSHKITDIKIDESGVVSGTIVLLNTPKGKIAQAIVEGGLPLFVSSRAVGNVDKNGGVMLERISTYDLVGTPGFSQARMHLNENQVCESLSDNLYYITNESEDDDLNVYEGENQNKDNQMNIDTILEKLNDLQGRIDDLEEVNNELEEQLHRTNEEFKSKLNRTIRNIADGVQKWVTEEYSPVVQKWVVEDYSDKLQGWITEEFAPVVQDWITEDYSAEVQNWIINDYSTRLQGWIAEEYSAEVQKWCEEDFAPVIQDWIIEEYSPTVEGWLSSEFVKGEAIQEALQSNQKDSLNSIDETLRLLENLEGPAKPTYKGATMITENLDEPLYVQQMPDEYRSKWNMASQEVKESIHRKAKLYNFLTEGAIDRFWSNINFEEVKPAQSIYEGLDNIQDQRERAIRMSLRRWGR